MCYSQRRVHLNPLANAVVSSVCGSGWLSEAALTPKLSLSLRGWQVRVCALLAGVPTLTEVHDALAESDTIAVVVDALPAVKALATPGEAWHQEVRVKLSAADTSVKALRSLLDCGERLPVRMDDALNAVRARLRVKDAEAALKKVTSGTHSVAVMEEALRDINLLGPEATAGSRPVAELRERIATARSWEERARRFMAAGAVAVAEGVEPPAASASTQGTSTAPSVTATASDPPVESAAADPTATATAQVSFAG
jgi:hypothetical protein